ncbi:polynucleotide kinase 3 phosphatase-domain-containing protein [Mycena metata]|uniref:Polynucleotide kinase 3 phosphatase-domain-containing protein n=1 Tax=Mycena metata TaxID=1033252 RepID=A0AAD7ITJ7_9AGAR|nr:polynucleotide kinase 3 phosphatase-domain-containing protein [Mycena metata]
MALVSASKKRTSSQLDSSDRSTKIAKIHPLFGPKPTPVAESGPLRWSKALGPDGSCLHVKHLDPPSSVKVAAFDLDGTVISSLPFSAPALQWHWWNASVPAKLKKAASEGYAIVMFSNQGGLRAAPRQKDWKKKIALIAAAVPDLPFMLFAATAKDNYRKPMIGMWQELERLYEAGGVKIDKASSFFVGDAAGRNYPSSTKSKDFASTDRKFALNVDVPFYTPEEYFLGKAPEPNFTLKGFHVSSLPSLPLYTPSSSPLIPSPPVQELVLFVGYPCLGKTTFFRQYFEPAGYIHINQDTLKTRIKCVKAVQDALVAGKKCVVDNTNRDASTRRYYIDVATKLKVPVRCMLFTGSLELAFHNNLYRAYCLPPSVAAREPRREALPKAAFTTFKDSFEEPELGEGLAQIKKVNWVFNGTPEERKAWSRWLQFDEK